MVNQSMQKLGEERSVIRELFEYGNRRKAEIGAENVFDFSIGNPSVPTPVCVRETIVRLLESVPAEVLHGYTSAAGDPAVRERVSRFYREKYGIEKSFVYMTCGAAASLTVTLRALCEKGDEVIVIAPYFPEYRVFIENAGGVCVPVCANETFHLDLEGIERAIGKRTKAVIVNSPNNPTGAVYGEEELRALSNLLARKSAENGAPIYLISDEPYRELTYVGEPPCIPALYRDTVICYSFSKSLSLAGERIGYILIPAACAEAETLYAAVCGAGRALGFVCAPALFQRTVAECLGTSCDIEEYRKNRDLLLSALTEYGFTCFPPEGAFYLFVRSPEPSADAFSARAMKHELLIVSSQSFGLDGYVRISYCVDRGVIKRSLPAFKALAAEYGLH